MDPLNIWYRKLGSQPLPSFKNNVYPKNERTGPHKFHDPHLTSFHPPKGGLSSHCPRSSHQCLASPFPYIMVPHVDFCCTDLGAISPRFNDKFTFDGTLFECSPANPADPLAESVLRPGRSGPLRAVHLEPPSTSFAAVGSHDARQRDLGCNGWQRPQGCVVASM